MADHQVPRGEPSRSISEDVKRAVRKNCGFGCAICGLPIWHYDHIEDFSSVQSHEVANLVLLCPNHHQDKTSGRLSAGVVRRAAAAPRNLLRVLSTPYPLLLAGDTGRLEVGGNVYEFDFSENNDPFEAIRIRGQTILGLIKEDDSLLLDLVMTDRSGEIVLKVARGEMAVSTQLWDYRIEGRNILIRSAPRKIELNLTLNTNGVTVNRGRFVRGSITLFVEPDHHTLLPMNHRMSGNTFRNCRIGMDIN